jgi:uncharacterized membrane protein
MSGLTTLGAFHTAFGLVALVAGAVGLWRDGEITHRNDLGKVYITTTVITCLTGFGIFQHGGFGKPHALGVLTLLVLAMVTVAAASHLFGRWTAHVQTVGYSATFLFHWIPGVTETSTRLPVGRPLFDSPEATELQVIGGVLFLIFLVGAYVQIKRLGRR